MMLRLILSCVLILTGAAAQTFNGVSLKVGDETAPAGGMVQMKVFVTEPKPISTGKSSFSFDSAFISSIDGIAMFSPARDVYGAAVVDAGSIRLTYLSPSATFGTTLDYPVITVAARIKPNLPLGSTMPMSIGSSPLFLGPLGSVYPTEVKNGQLTIAPGVSVMNVTPGSAALAAGSVVTLSGINFDAFTTVRLAETKIAEAKLVNANRIDLTLGSAVDMHGERIRVNNRDGSADTYFSYQRTVPAAASTRALLAKTVPVFPQAAFSTATFLQLPFTGKQWFALAFQNLNPQAALIRIEQVHNGVTVGSTSINLAANTRIARTVEELQGSATPGTLWRITASAPVQLLSLFGDDAAQSVFPVIPIAAK